MNLLADLLSTADIVLFRTGSTSVTVGTLVVVLAFVIGVWWLAAIMERVALRLSRKYVDEPWKLSRFHLLSRLIRYAVWIVGTLLCLNFLGLDLRSLALFSGAIGIGLGFGLQNVFSNFISGIIILLERSLKVGDFVDLASGVRGHVREIGMRYTRVTTNDAIDVLVPNSEFINGRVTNWTLDDSSRRMHAPFGVAYGTPKELVREACKAAAKRVPGVLDSQGMEADVWLQAYGDNAVNYELVFWVGRELSTHPSSCHAQIMWALDDELQARKIEIPFPQRDLNLRSGVLEVKLQQPTATTETTP
ncbi:MAG: mechanosensitive ion channel domain-containing protein [Lysobacteraceae bacterium]